jgi:hypothetical protein
MHTSKTQAQYKDILGSCKELFLAKFDDYGPSWRFLRLDSVCDQILIKARRIRRLEDLQGKGRIPDTAEDEFRGIVNYCVIALIKLTHVALTDDEYEVCMENLTKEEIRALFESILARGEEILNDKNHDYNEAWRLMRLSSITDEMLVRVARIRSLSSREGAPRISENIDSQVFDCMNYAAFALIKIRESAAERDQVC